MENNREEDPGALRYMSFTRYGSRELIPAGCAKLSRTDTNLLQCAIIQFFPSWILARVKCKLESWHLLDTTNLNINTDRLRNPKKSSTAYSVWFMHCAHPSGSYHLRCWFQSFRQVPSMTEGKRWATIQRLTRSLDGYLCSFSSALSCSVSNFDGARCLCMRGNGPVL
jgi:hypothetical protein